MPNYVADAIEIITDDGTGVPSTYSNTSLGLDSDGHFYLITGRFGLDGSKIVTGDSGRSVWYEGILTKLGGDLSVSRKCDFIQSGNLEMVSGMTFNLVNVTDIVSTLENNNVYLARCQVKWYRVTSSDGISFNFKLRWSGVIDDQDFDELVYAIPSVDSSKEIFTRLPTRKVDSGTFPNAASASKDKIIPILLGRVRFAPLVTVVQDSQRIELCKAYRNGAYPGGMDEGSPQFIAPIVGYDASNNSLGTPSIIQNQPSVFVLTRGESFSENDPRLVDKYLCIVKGGAKQARKIIYNKATTNYIVGIFHPAYPSYATDTVTELILEEVLDESTPFTNGWVYPDNSTLVWYCEVRALSALSIFSNKTISQILNGSTGKPAAYTFASDRKVYEDVSEVFKSSDTSTIKGAGYPGLETVSINNDVEGSISVYTPVYPDSARLVAGFRCTIDGVDANTTTLPSTPKLIDRDTSVAGSHEIAFTDDIANISFQLFFNKKKWSKSYDALYLLCDYDQKVDTETIDNVLADIRVNAYLIDFFGRQANILNQTLPHSTVTNFYVNKSYLPGSYFGISRNDYLFQVTRASWDIASQFADAKDNLVWDSMEIRLTPGVPASVGNKYYLRLREVGFVAKKIINVSSEPLYASAIGETFGTTWGGRKTATDPIYNVVDSLEHLIRNYDYAIPIWQASSSYSVGQKVRKTIDNNHFYVCTSAGTSGASEPGFPAPPSTPFVTGAANNGSGIIRISMASHGLVTGNSATLAGIVGTTEANGTWTVTVITSNTFDLQGSTFLHAYTSGGYLTRARVSDGGVTWQEAGTFKIDTAAFDALQATRNWYVGRALMETRDSETWYTELMAQTFQLGTQDAWGRVRPVAWRESTTPVFTFNASNILPGTLGRMQKSPMRRIWNDILVRYDWNPGTQSFNKQIFITHVDEPAFPSATETLSLGVSLPAVSQVFLIDNGDGTYKFLIATATPHGLSTGDYVGMSGNSSGANFGPTQVSVYDDSSFYVPGFLTVANPADDGVIKKYTDARLKWQSFAGGFKNYQTGKSLWEQLHQSWKIHKAVFKNPPESSDCYWFIDPGATDPGGNRLWPDLEDSDEYPAMWYMKMLCAWSPWQKPMNSLQVGDIAAHDALNIGDCIYLNDAKETAGSDLLGWIHEKTYVPATDDMDVDRILFGLTFNPKQFTECMRIIDTPGAANRILDTVGATNRILDTPC